MGHAVTRLFEQFATERGFNWYARDPEWRRVNRELYPVEHVAAYHRQDFPPSFFNDHARRFKAFQRYINERLERRSPA